MKAKGLLYKIYMLCTQPVKGWFYMFVFLLNLVSNYVVTSEDNMPFTYFSVFFLSAFIAYIESAIYVVLTKKSIKRLYVVLITLLHSILIACEYFLLLRFNTFLNQGIVNIIGETNREEATHHSGKDWKKPSTIPSVPTTLGTHYLMWQE